MLSGFQKLMLWVSFLGVIFIIVWVIILSPCNCSTADIEVRLDNLEVWADSQGVWHDEVQVFLDYIEATHNLGQSQGTIDFWPPSGGAGDDPPGGPPCKLGGC